MAEQQQRIVVAGASGNLGARIVKALVGRGAHVVALTRSGTAPQKMETLGRLGAELATVDPRSAAELASACAGASCVVSALLGLREVMVEAQGVLLEGAVRAHVPRFIPSDYSLDFNQLRPGENRNLDFHREFQQRVDRAPIAATSILNGAFMELLVGDAPLILFKWHRVLYWGNREQVLDFTTMDDVAAYTAAAALDPSTPRFLKIAGQQLTPSQLAQLAGEVTGERFTLQWAGTLGMLRLMIGAMRAVMPSTSDPFPPWQGMQYTHNMFSGRGALTGLDNARYPELTWTQVRDVLAARKTA